MADEQTGQELRKFFIELLEGTNLRDYHEARTDYIRARILRIDEEGREQGFLGDGSTRLLECDCLREIEENIRLVTGSHNAVPVLIVFPPY